MEFAILFAVLGGVVLADSFGLLDIFSGAKDDDSAPSNVREGTSADDDLDGAESNDFILGKSGADTISGGAGADLLLGESGADLVQGGRGADLILGGNGFDTLIGGKGDDYLVGGAGDDSVVGSDGSDVLIGTSGADTLEGGAGNDLIVGLDPKAGLSALQINSNTQSEGEAQSERDILISTISRAFGDDVVGNQDQRIEAALSSGDSNATDDVLFGGRGDDVILGDNGDTMVGGSGNDIFAVVSARDANSVVINDFNPAQDRINITVPQGTGTSFVLEDGETPEVGVFVVVNGDTAAILKNLTAAQITVGRITVTAEG